MSIFDVISLLGGLAMFLYGMRLMGNALKENSSGTLKNAMEKVTNNPLKAFVLGILVTALIQSSTATIVITSGLVAAGILSLHQSIGIIVGANVGTTVTGQIIRLLDIDASGTSVLRFFQPSTLAPIAMIIGIVFIMGAKGNSSKSIGGIAVGFGILFTGLLNMTSAVNSLSESGMIEGLFESIGDNPLLGYVIGAGIAFMLQSSSATIGILQAFSAAGLMPFKGIYAVIVGIYLGDCVTTAIVCSIGAKAEQKRVGVVNILFNLSETVLVLVVVTILHRAGALDWIWEKPVNSSIIANTNTIFNFTCAICLLPMLGIYEKLSRKIVKDDPVQEGKYKEKLDALSPVFFKTPALALNSCYDILMTMFNCAVTNIRKSFALLNSYDAKVHAEINEEEEEIDRMTDRMSHYTVELLPYLQNELHVSILNAYYKVTAEFERLGDHACNIADIAETLHRNGTHFSDAATAELAVLEELTNDILDNAGQSFEKRDVDAAARIELLAQAAVEMTSQLKKNHLVRMSNGECDVYADATFSNLMGEFKRLSDICSNIGIATVLRVRPELADHEHLYYESLRAGKDAQFNSQYEKVYNTYFSKLPGNLT